jgi:alkylated DNA repair protein (DNA oxidative demethylase)
MIPDLFEGAHPDVPLAPGAVLLAGFARPLETPLVSALDEIVARSPFRHLLTPGGRRMSVAMTNCGSVGWVSDTNGYRYEACDPATASPWPPMPAVFRDLARGAAETAGFPGFSPDACLINRYGPGARLSLHQDKDELDVTAPIVSVSLGLPAVFLFGGLHRSEPTRRVGVHHGDVVVWGGPSRLRYHGVLPVEDGVHPMLGACRINLTFRKTK